MMALSRINIFYRCCPAMIVLCYTAVPAIDGLSNCFALPVICSFAGNIFCLNSVKTKTKYTARFLLNTNPGNK